MGVGVDITIYDVVVFAIFALLIIRGVWLGFLKQITGLIALYLGYIVAGRHHETLFPFLSDYFENPKVVFLISCLILFFITYVVVMLLGKLLNYVMQISFTSWFDRFLGAILGGAKAVIVVLIVHMVLGVMLAPESQTLKKCMSCDLLNEGADMAREIIASDDVRKALKQKEPAISLDAVREYLNNTLEDEPPAEPASSEEVKKE